MAFVSEPSPGLPEDLLQAAFESTPTPSLVVAPGHASPVVVAVNQAFLDLMMLERPAVEGRRIDTVFRATAASQVRHAVKQCLADGDLVRLRIGHAPATELMRLQIELRRFHAGAEAFVVLTLCHLADRVRLAELGEAGVLAELGPLSRGLVCIKDVTRGRFRHARHPLASKLGLGSGAQDASLMHAKVHPSDRESFERFLAAQASAVDDRLLQGTFRTLAANGEWLWLNIRSRPLTRDREGAINRIISVVTDVTEEHLHAANLADAAYALANAEVNERRRIGRELHDSTAQLLLAARLSLGALERRAVLAPEDAEALTEARQWIASAQREIRNFAYVLHPPSLQTEGLANCLRGFAVGFSRRTGLDIKTRVARNFGRLPTQVELALYRVLQEALMNVYRHAQAQRARVRLKVVGGCAVLEVQDDGIGLPTLAAGAREAGVEGVGISGMRARMVQLGGELQLESDGAGVLVRASAPIAAAAGFRAPRSAVRRPIGTPSPVEGSVVGEPVARL